MPLFLAPAHNLEDCRSFPLHLGRSNLAKWWWSTCPCKGATTRQPCDYCRTIVAKNVGFVSRKLMHVCKQGILTLDTSLKDNSRNENKNGCVVRVNDMTVLWGKKQLWEGDVITIGRYSTIPWITLHVIKKVDTFIPSTPKVTSQSKLVTPEANNGRRLRAQNKPGTKIPDGLTTLDSNPPEKTQLSWINKRTLTSNEPSNPVDQKDVKIQRNYAVYSFDVDKTTLRRHHRPDTTIANSNAQQKYTKSLDTQSNRCHNDFGAKEVNTITSQQLTNQDHDVEDTFTTTCATSNHTVPRYEEDRKKKNLMLQSNVRRRNLFFFMSEENNVDSGASKDCTTTTGEQQNLITTHMKSSCDVDTTKYHSLSKEHSKSKSYLDTQGTINLQVEQPQNPKDIMIDKDDNAQEESSSILFLPQCPTYHSDKSSDQISLHHNPYCQQQRQLLPGDPNFQHPPLDQAVDPLTEFSPQVKAARQ
jgi:hypothetical protein